MRTLPSGLVMIVLFLGCSGGLFNKTFEWQTEYDSQDNISKLTAPGKKIIVFDNSYYKDYPGIRQSLKIQTEHTETFYEFDIFGRRTALADETGKTRYGYNAEGRLKVIHCPENENLEYEYYANGLIRKLKSGTEYQVEYKYDFLGRLEAMVTTFGTIRYKYYEGNKVVRTLPNGIWSMWTYNSQNQLVSLIHANADNQILAKYEYAYNGNGLIISANELHGNRNRKLIYEYDEAHRLKKCICNKKTICEYTYDTFGNVLKETATGKHPLTVSYNWNGGLRKINNKKCKNDPSGNLCERETESQKIKYSYNNLNQMVRADHIRYTYNGDGSLAKRADKEETGYVTDPSVSVWKPVKAKSESSMVYYIWEGNTPLMRIVNGKPEFLLTDYLGSVRTVANARSEVTESIHYSPYGEPLEAMKQKGLFPGFSGLFFDTGSGLYITRNRTYDPRIKRFLQIDPLFQIPDGSQKDYSLYTYCGGDPVNFIDRQGTQSKWRDIFNAQQAKKDYAKWAEKSISEANQSNWIWKGLQSSFFEIVGGYIPGEAESRGQALASVMFSLTGQNIGIVQTMGSALINSSEGDYKGALFDIISLGGTYSGLKAKRLYQTPINMSGNQLGFSFMDDKIIKKAKVYDFVSKAAKAIGEGKKRYDALKSGDINSFAYSCFTQTMDHHFPDSKIPYSEILDLYNISKKDFGNSASSNVGGVYLKNAGQSVEGFENITGVSHDPENDRLFLLSEEAEDALLLPFRMDDLVTVFRSVYLNGEAPYVSIDPNPEDPEGDILLTRHGDATNNTFVGWVLFETDRLMKAYSLGEDNITRRQVKCNIPGYNEVLRSMYESDISGQIWERYWIVPSRIARKISDNTNTILFEVPLRVKTQKMIMKNGRLENDPTGQSSAGAKAFSTWFTENYDRIAATVASMPPEGTGFADKIHVFKELQRIACITAIAETLFKKGIEMPKWMVNYKVKTFPVPKTTPAIKITKENGTGTRSIYGGVNLLPPDENITTLHSDLKAGELSQTIRANLTHAEFFRPAPLDKGSGKIKALALPGNNTKALSPCSFSVTDLVLPVSANRAISLQRHYNSFFHPKETVFGEIWTLNLPYLQKRTEVSRRKEKETSKQTVYYLTSDLNTISGKAEKLYTGSNRAIGFETNMVKQKNKQYHFNEEGCLVGIEEQHFTQVYVRNSACRIVRIEGWLANQRMAALHLIYNTNRQIEEIRNGDQVLVSYSYDVQGRLAKVQTGNDNTLYDYDAHLITSVIQNDFNRAFQYNKKGQLLSISDQEGSTDFEITKNSSGQQMRISRNKTEAVSVLKYDQAFRPVYKLSDDSTEIRWTYYEDKSMVVNKKSPDNHHIKTYISGDRRIHQTTLPAGQEITTQFNESGKVESHCINGKPVFTQQYNSFGLPEKQTNPINTINYRYSARGTLERVLCTPPHESDRYTQWEDYRFDSNGRLTGKSNSDGETVDVSFLENEIHITTNQERYKLLNNPKEKSVKVYSDNGSAEIKYNKENQTDQIKILKNNSMCNIQYEKGRIKEIMHFNGSKTFFEYDKNQNLTHLSTPVNNIKYNRKDGAISINCDAQVGIEVFYDTKGRLTKVVRKRL